MAFAPMPWPATSLGVGSGCAARSGYGRGGNRRWPGGCFRANLGLRAVATHPVAARRPRLPFYPPIPAEVGAAVTGNAFRDRESRLSDQDDATRLKASPLSKQTP